MIFETILPSDHLYNLLILSGTNVLFWSYYPFLETKNHLTVTYSITECYRPITSVKLKLFESNLRSLPEKTADVSRGRHLSPRKTTSE